MAEKPLSYPIGLEDVRPETIKQYIDSQELGEINISLLWKQLREKNEALAYALRNAAMSLEPEDLERRGKLFTALMMGPGMLISQQTHQELAAALQLGPASPHHVELSDTQILLPVVE